MKIKRFVAPDMRTAFALVRQEHGPDAVILSNRMTDDGVEIVAASNYDESLVQRTLDAMRPAAEAPSALPSFVRNASPDSAAIARTAPPAGHAAPMSPAEAAAAYFQRRAPQAAPVQEPQPSMREAAPAARRDSDDALPAFLRDSLRDTRPAGDARPGESIYVGIPTPEPLAADEPAATLPPAALNVDPMSFAARLAASLPQAPLNATAPQNDTRAESNAPAAPQLDAPAHPLDTAATIANVPATATPAQTPERSAPVTLVADNARLRENDEQLAQMRAELAAMRGMIEDEMHRLTDERLKGSPVRAQAMELMDDYGFDAGITRDVALQIPADTDLHRGRGLMLGLLSRRLPILPQDPLENGGVIALVGPTGAGKTTTIAKLAAAFADRHNPRDVALVTTDTVRVGGREQLHSYGRQLGIAVHEADSDVRLAQLLEKLSDYKLVLIDTAGLGQRDKNLIAQLNWLRAAGQVHTLLVLPANSHFADLDEVVRRFSGAQPQGVVLTKVDETGRLGSALSVVVDHQLPMAWITDGQRVPEDLHRASAPNLVLRLDQLRREADEATPAETIHVA